ncbi:hypothetical protein NDU88_000937 [Pleurodeles waltl]|uniref:Uncharacterized protein n=1 Tax=Pleurodeles waltl TaxID=8319 RepID=A0AAV7PB45_PLEWA|nr:hypothetical protein NDU88_000937 [Pleurodeles waltl]
MQALGRTGVKDEQSGAGDAAQTGPAPGAKDGEQDAGDAAQTGPAPGAKDGEQDAGCRRCCTDWSSPWSEGWEQDAGDAAQSGPAPVPVPQTEEHLLIRDLTLALPGRGGHGGAPSRPPQETGFCTC